MTHNPRPIYEYALTYRTPSGRLVSYATRQAGYDASEGRATLDSRLAFEKRRRVAQIVRYDAPRFITLQIVPGFDECTREQWADYLADAPRHYQTTWNGAHDVMASIVTDTGECIAQVHYIGAHRVYLIKRG